MSFSKCKILLKYSCYWNVNKNKVTYIPKIRDIKKHSILNCHLNFFPFFCHLYVFLKVENSLSLLLYKYQKSKVTAFRCKRYVNCHSGYFKIHGRNLFEKYKLFFFTGYRSGQFKYSEWLRRLFEFFWQDNHIAYLVVGG